MNYAIIKNDIVVNVIVGPLPNGINGITFGDRPIAINDTYDGVNFYRNGEIVKTSSELLLEAQSIIINLLAALAEATNE